MTSGPVATPPAQVLVLHGPNLGLLGAREPEIYGSLTLAELDAQLVAHGRARGLAVSCEQSDEEGRLVGAVGRARQQVAALVLNPGAYAHTSIALYDALRAFPGPAIEVHLSNVHAREGFRHRLVTGAACRGVISGMGPLSYRLALDAVASLLAGSAA